MVLLVARLRRIKREAAVSHAGEAGKPISLSDQALIDSMAAVQMLSYKEVERRGRCGQRYSFCRHSAARIMDDQAIFYRRADQSVFGRGVLQR